MQVLPAATAAQIASRNGLLIRTLIWITAKNRTTGAAETLGLWTGDDDATITVEGTPRLYFGAGGLVGMEPVSARVGLDVQMVRATLTPLAPEVEMLLRGYETRQAPIEVHRSVHDPRSGILLDPPSRRLKGWVDSAEIVSASEEGAGRAQIEIASNARAGTRGLALKKSDESTKLRLLPGGAPDRFHRYADISGKAQIKWGEA